MSIATIETPPVATVFSVRWLRHVPMSVLISALVFVFVLVLCVIPESFFDLSQNIILGTTPAATPGHLLGTDALGRDILALTLAGARSALIGPVAIAAGSIIIGLLFGTLAGYFGGFLDTLVTRYVDLTLSLPSLLLAIVVAGVTGGSYWVTVLLFVVLFSPSDTWLVRSAVLQQRHLPYIEAVKVLHLSNTRIMVGHILPNVRPLALTEFFLNVAYGLVSMSSLSYLGLGVAPDAADWGRQLSDGRMLLYTNPAASVVPALAIIAVATAANVMGDWLEGELQGDER